MTRLAAALVLLAACSFEPFELRSGGGGDSGSPGADASDGDGGAPRPDATPACTPSGPDDQCDEIDNDCNGIVDDAFDKQTDGNHCGVCGNRCTSPGAIEQCSAGMCEFVECQPGFKDLDAGEPGCEYLCPIFPEIAEDCNGVDDDCDGTADEIVDLPPPPAGLCRVTAGTPCEGTSMICASRGTPAVTRWYCDYSSEVEFDPSVPNGIALNETLCDGFDGDCDGAPDDPFTDLGQECDNGALGICRDVGARVCDPSDPSQTICDLSVPPDPIGSATAEVCNGRDDNCDGIVDNPTGPDRVIDDMVHITHSGLDFHIYRYEASRPDATSSDPGVASGRACANADVLPWGGLTYASAAAACAAAGKRLCTGPEYTAACAGAAGNVYPFGDTFDADTCNAEPFDGVPGGADDDVLLSTGGAALAACTSDDAVHDLSGNLKEWTDDVRGTTGPPDNVDIVVLRGGAYNTPAAGATCDFDLSRLPKTTIVNTVGFRCCSDAAP